jgi:hypothetical protein
VRRVGCAEFDAALAEEHESQVFRSSSASSPVRDNCQGIAVVLADPDSQIAAGVGLIQRRGQYRLRSLGAMQLPEIAYMLEPRLALFGYGRLEADGHGDDGRPDRR